MEGWKDATKDARSLVAILCVRLTRHHGAFFFAIEIARVLSTPPPFNSFDQIYSTLRDRSSALEDGRKRYGVEDVLPPAFCPFSTKVGRNGRQRAN